MGKVFLRQKKISGGKLSLYLDYYPAIINPKTGTETRREFLGLHILEDPITPEEKKENKKVLDMAEIIRSTRFIQVKNEEFGLKDNIKLNINFVEFYESIVIEHYNSGSTSNYASWSSSLKHFKIFADKRVMSQQITSVFVRNYRSYLLTAKSGRKDSAKPLSRNTASTYFKNFITVLKKAYKEKILKENLAEEAEYIKEIETHREYLSEDELHTLWNTPIKIEVVKHVAFFTVLTGIRFVDVNKLTWDDVFSDIHQIHYIKLREQKTQSIYNQPISDTAFDILKLYKDNEGVIFGGIQYSRITRPLAQWIEESGIRKKISYHNFRHSYATLQLANGTDIFTVSKLLGHKNVSTTQIYTKVMDRNKIEAANRINLNLNGLPKES